MFLIFLFKFWSSFTFQIKILALTDVCLWWYLGYFYYVIVAFKWYIIRLPVSYIYIDISSYFIPWYFDRKCDHFNSSFLKYDKTISDTETTLLWKTGDRMIVVRIDGDCVRILFCVDERVMQIHWPVKMKCCLVGKHDIVDDIIVSLLFTADKVAELKSFNNFVVFWDLLHTGELPCSQSFTLQHSVDRR